MQLSLYQFTDKTALVKTRKPSWRKG